LRLREGLGRSPIKIRDDDEACRIKAAFNKGAVAANFEQDFYRIFIRRTVHRYRFFIVQCHLSSAQNKRRAMTPSGDSSLILSQSNWRRAGTRCCSPLWRRFSMLDVMMVAIALGFFVLALGYVIACDRM
jgi:hypothetical protein